MIRLLALLLLISTAQAEPPPGADQSLSPWFRSLKVPKTQTSCCSIADCRTVVTRTRDGKLEAFIPALDFPVATDQWLEVPESVIIHGVENPAGGPVACFFGNKIQCFIDGSGT